MLKLSDQEPFSSGHKRACYVHPERADLCVKVMLPSAPRTFRGFRPAWHYDENLSEARSSEKLQRRLGPTAGMHFAESHGLVETDRGQGLVTDLIRNADGSIATTLQEYLKTNGLGPAGEKALEALYDFIVQHRICIRDPGLTNIVMQKRNPEEYCAYFIDGLGNAELIPWSEWFGFLGRRKALRKCAKIRNRVRRMAKAKP